MLAGAICLIVALTLPWYENAQGKLGAWATFGPAVVLLIICAGAALLLALATVTERNHRASWQLPSGALCLDSREASPRSVRLLERPEHATELCGLVARADRSARRADRQLVVLRDERTSMYSTRHHAAAPGAALRRRTPEAPRGARLRIAAPPAVADGWRRDRAVHLHVPLQVVRREHVSTGADGVSIGFNFGLDAWHSLTNTRWLLLLTIVSALLAVGASCAGASWTSRCRRVRSSRCSPA